MSMKITEMTGRKSGNTGLDSNQGVGDSRDERPDGTFQVAKSKLPGNPNIKFGVGLTGRRPRKAPTKHSLNKTPKTKKEGSSLGIEIMELPNTRLSADALKNYMEYRAAFRRIESAQKSLSEAKTSTDRRWFQLSFSMSVKNLEDFRDKMKNQATSSETNLDILADIGRVLVHIHDNYATGY